MIETVKSNTFAQNVLEAKGPVAVEFMAYGCAHCRAIEPILPQAAASVESSEKAANAPDQYVI